MTSVDREMLDRAARAALRAAGCVEPNPLVGCAIGRDDGTLLAIGHHRRFGGNHAEVDALHQCRERGADPRGATCWVTLEPCAHHGKTPPCTSALIDAGIRRVVIARRDPSPSSAGGAEALGRAGIQVDECTDSARARLISEPFIKRTVTGLPWVIAKWAQTIDGAIATSSGASQWISNEASRRRVHRLRARVGAVLTGIGTVRADDPRLTARDVHVRRVARRVVIDPRLETPRDSALIRTLDDAPLTIATVADAPGAARLRSAGAEVVALPDGQGGVDCRALLGWLAERHDVTNVLVEAGPRLLGRLHEEDLIDELQVYVAPVLMADPDAPAPVRGPRVDQLSEAKRFKLVEHHLVRGDVLLRYVRPSAATC